jgi:hypothetical protein
VNQPPEGRLKPAAARNGRPTITARQHFYLLVLQQHCDPERLEERCRHLRWGMDTEKQTVQEMIDEVTHPDGCPPPAPAPKPAELDQDAGGGYNANFTDPQT